ncbi:hypothetical protein DAMA08_014030 [Martiniozyma asiatica (nom. inval.)]|nr:hypothetical protein DAMA08_014030 [Martiniozyma asiatica]
MSDLTMEVYLPPIEDLERPLSVPEEQYLRFYEKKSDLFDPHYAALVLRSKKFELMEQLKDKLEQDLLKEDIENMCNHSPITDKRMIALYYLALIYTFDKKYTEAYQHATLLRNDYLSNTGTAKNDAKITALYLSCLSNKQFKPAMIFLACFLGFCAFVIGLFTFLGVTGRI